MINLIITNPFKKLSMLLLTVVLILSSCSQNAQNTTSEAKATPAEKIDPMSIRNNYVPSSISQEAQKTLKSIYAMKPYERVFPDADNLDGWRKTHDEAEKAKKEVNDNVVQKYQAKVSDAEIAGVPVVHIYPKNWKDNGKVFVYVHGGAYTMFSAHSTLNSAVPMADATGLHIISIDYTTAPFAKWKEIQEQVVSVIKELLKQGYTMEDIAIYGDSAGGGLAMSTVHNLRDLGIGMPAAVVLLSPWADISETGDTYHTLENTDPMLHNDPLLKTSAEAYAGDLDLKDQRVSPIYGDFSKGFSPSLITEGTKCVFLSNSVRAYQAIEAAGVEAKLDVYEGMWHVFQIANLDMPESKASFKKIAVFVNRHLNK